MAAGKTSHDSTKAGQKKAEAEKAAEYHQAQLQLLQQHIDAIEKKSWAMDKILHLFFLRHKTEAPGLEDEGFTSNVDFMRSELESFCFNKECDPNEYPKIFGHTIAHDLSGLRQASSKLASMAAKTAPSQILKVQNTAEHLAELEEYVVESSESVAEVWRRIPQHITGEIFAFLELRQSTRLCRVSSSWKKPLMKLGFFNRGLVFSSQLPELVDSDDRFQWDYNTIRPNTLDPTKKRPISDFVLLNPGSVRHLVFLGRIDLLYMKETVVKKLIKYCAFTTTVTFHGDNRGSDWYYKRCEILSPKISRVILMNCQHSVGLSTTAMPQRELYRSNVVYWKYFAGSALSWLFTPKPMIKLVMDKDSRPLQGECVELWEMKLVKRIDEQGGIWPFSKSVTSWLTKMTKRLRGELLEEVKKKDREYMQSPRVLAMKSMNLWKSGIRSDATSDKRELDSLDCVFFAKLLFIVDDLKDKPVTFTLEDVPPTMAAFLFECARWFLYVRAGTAGH